MKRFFFFLLFFVIAFLIQVDVQAQVTVGSNHKPNIGSLLDLKEYEDKEAMEGGRSALGGLGLPRVKISKIKPETPAELASSIGNTGEWELNDHVGLVVYSSVADQCALTPIETGVHVFDGTEWQQLLEKNYKTEVAANSDRSDWKSAWGDKVVIHGEKKDAEGKIVYKEFISGDFGQAGRWMTTNIAAFQYDTDLPSSQYHSAGRSLSGASGNPDDKLNEAYWAYPRLSGSVIAEGEGPSEQFLENPYIGLLYTWDAATAGKGGQDGTLNVDQPNPSSEAYENGLPEWDGTGVQPANAQKRRQGVCPKGWHVPSDYEWTELEREIIRNTSLYADMENIDNGDGTELAKVQQPPNPGSPIGEDPLAIDETTPAVPELFRGSTHGTAMKGVCPIPGSTYSADGKSSVSHKGGFNIFLTGRIIVDSPRAAGYSSLSIPWSSSTYVGNTNEESGTSYVAICRSFRRDKEQIYRAAYKREYMNSVRCKKDD